MWTDIKNDASTRLGVRAMLRVMRFAWTAVSEDFVSDRDDKVLTASIPASRRNSGPLDEMRSRDVRRERPVLGEAAGKDAGREGPAKALGAASGRLGDDQPSVGPLHAIRRHDGHGHVILRT